MASQAQQPARSRLILLGSASSVPSATQDTTYLVWQGPETVVLMDCGGSPLLKLQRAGVNLDALQHVILTHGHVDHVYGLPILVQGLWLMGRRTPLCIWGPPDALRVAGQIMDAVDWQSWPGLFPVHWRPALPPAVTELFAGPDLVVSAVATQHSVPAIAVRVQDRDSGRAAVYSSDTEPCAAVVALAQDADLLVHEATCLQSCPGGHSTAAQAGQVARQARVGRLVLVHVSPLQDDPMALQQAAQAAFGGDVQVGQDGAVYWF
ncbi:MAG: MBL fold metallo-hydrolase [Chloroflexi bacterium]|nr:MBL fold metallo-hydrolase [Chloroflexota bacterium]